MARTKQTTNVAVPVSLSLIAGILILAGHAWSLLMGGGYAGMWGSQMMGGSNIYGGLLQPWATIGFSVLYMATGALILAGSFKMNRKPEEAKKWGIVVLAGSVAALFGMGGFIVGPILGIIGGIAALAKK